MIKDFRKKVLERKKNVSDKDFFYSEQCLAYLNNLTEALCKTYNNSIRVILKWQEDDMIAFATNRSELFINLNNIYVNKVDERVEKLIILKALVLHECGHLLFTDFHLLKSMKKVFLNNRELFPKPKCTEHQEWMTDAALFDEKTLAEWYSVWKYLENSIEDGFIENMVLEAIPGEGQCLYPLRKQQYEEFDSIKVMKNNNLTNSQILFNCILSMAKYNTVKMDKDDNQEPAIEALLSCYDLIKSATHTKKSYERVKQINEIFCKLYKFMKEEEKKQEQSEKSQDSQSEKSKDSEQNQNEESPQNQTKESDSSSSSSCPENSSKFGGYSKTSPSDLLSNAPSDGIKDDIDTGTGSVLNDRNINQQQEEKAKSRKEMLDALQNNTSSDTAIPSPSDKRVTDSIEEELAKEEVMKQTEEDLKEQLRQEVASFDFTSINKNVNCQIIRHEPSDYAKKIYKQDMDEISFLVKKTVDEIRNRIKDKQQGGKINGLYQGRYLDRNSLYRFDLRMLCKNDLPEDIPNMTFAILIDASGSMNSHKKLESARRTALLLYQFGRALNIPVMVYSHNCSFHDVTLNALADYGSVDGNDKYRICDLSTSGCNRDGMALRFVSEKLAQRHEETKLCFVISDGLPSAYDNSSLAYEDIRNVLMDYAKRNVKYISFGLGDNQIDIEKIYTQNLSPKIAAKFIKTDDATLLPKAVVQSIKEIVKV